MDSKLNVSEPQLAWSGCSILRKTSNTHQDTHVQTSNIGTENTPAITFFKFSNWSIINYSPVLLGVVNSFKFHINAQDLKQYKIWKHLKLSTVTLKVLNSRLTLLTKAFSTKMIWQNLAIWNNSSWLSTSLLAFMPGYMRGGRCWEDAACQLAL